MLRSSHQKAISRRWSQNVKRLLATYSQAETLAKYPVGLSLHGYSIQDVKPVPEFSLVAVKLKHLRTGLEHLHLDSPTDNNNVFSVAFKTNPPDATGVPHILEHTTLCGSYTYPVLDPFFKMLNRSLSNFMNAMTGHDYTYYPFATTNRKDFDNLMSVYLSSVFEPRLTHEDFMQEGWRLENSDPNDKTSPIEFKGVVFNEMKGQHSNTNYLFYIKFQQAIYPSLNYSGGDPAKIITLEHEDLLDFHNANYHPSNAKTFTYGTFPLSEHLQKLNELYARFGTKSIGKEVKSSFFAENPSVKRHQVEVAGPVDAMSDKPVEEQYKASVTWHLGNPLEENKLYEVFKWKLLNSLLFDGHNAPLYQELIETQFGEDFSANSGLDQTSALLSFTVGLDGLTSEKVSQLEEKVLSILTKSVLPQLEENGLFKERVEALLHQIELGFKKHKPEFGLSLLDSVIPSWVNGVDATRVLQVQTILNRFKEEYEAEGLSLFKQMLQDTILNPSTPVFKFQMTPDPKYNDNIENQEKLVLQERVAALSEEDKLMIFERGQMLQKKQQTVEDVSSLPTLTVDDIPRQGNQYPVSHKLLSGQENVILKRVTATNDLVYLTATKDLSYVPQHLYAYLPFFCTCLTNLAGTENTPITKLENKIQQHTGGVRFSVSAITSPYDIMAPSLKLVMSGMAFLRNSSHIYLLWEEILALTKFDAEDPVLDKLSVLIRNMAQNQANVIADRGHSYANRYGNSQLTPTKHIQDVFAGMRQVELNLNMSRQLEKRGKEYLESELLPILRDIKKLFVNENAQGQSTAFKYHVVADAKGVRENEELIEAFDRKMAAAETSLVNHLKDYAQSFEALKNTKTIWNFPFQVGYSSLATTGAAYASESGAALQALSQITTSKHLHSVIREANGAYGGGLSYDGLGGILDFYSYRDPNALKSALAFEKTASVVEQKLREKIWDQSALHEAKMSIFQSVDAPHHVASEGVSQFMEGITDEMKQERRERFLDLTLDDIQKVNDKYLMHAENKICTILGNAETLGAGEDWAVKSFQM